MKKILALVTFLVVFAACSTEPPAGPTVSNANRAVSAPPAAGLSEADATAKEKAVWETLKKKDYDGFGSMLTSDYIEVGGDGVFDKAGVIAYVKDLVVTDVSFANWKLLPVDKDAAILMYDVTIKGTYKNVAFPAGPYRASSCWANRDGKWLAIFYQETLAKPATQAAATASPASQSAASPAAKAALGTPGPDPEANEKIVWDAIKGKNYDGFGAMLAPEAVEVEADGVYDRAGSIKGVGMFDASKVQLSDWKTTKIDNDASIVTYVVTMPGAKPSRERHSSIWVNNSGKWAALFHQGTPQEGPPAPPVAKK